MLQIEELRKFTDEMGGQIAIYGAGFTGKEVYRWLKSNNVRVDRFFVTDDSMSDSSIDNVPVEQFDKTVIDKSTRVIVAIKYPWNQSVEEELERLGVYLYKLGNSSFDKKPRHIEITTQIGCSVNCKFCPQSALVTNYSSNTKKMSVAAFSRMIDKLPDDMAIVFSGFSEPFLNEEAIDMMEYVSACGREMYLNTTLVGLAKEKLELLTRLKFQRNILHLPDKEHYANIPLTEEYYELLDMVLDARKENCEGIESPFFDSANCQGEVLDEVARMIHGRIHVFSALSDRAGNLTTDDGSLNRVEYMRGKLYCYASPHFHNHVLLPDGTVVLCCMDFGLRHVLGNLMEQGYEEIQNGKEMRAVQRALSEDYDVLCRSCTEAKMSDPS